MTQIISAIQSKGGAGKSSMIQTIAGSLVREKAKVLIIDTDPQQSSASWAELTKWDGLDSVELLNEDQLFSVIEKVSSKYDTILIDTAGYDSRMATYAITISDLVLIPTNAAKSDVTGATGVWKHIKALTSKNDSAPDIKILFWKVKGNAGVYKHARQMFANAGIKTLDGAVEVLTGFDNITWTGGLPDGAAKQACVSFMYQLRQAGLIKYEYKSEAA